MNDETEEERQEGLRGWREKASRDDIPGHEASSLLRELFGDFLPEIEPTAWALVRIYADDEAALAVQCAKCPHCGRDHDPVGGLVRGVADAWKAPDLPSVDPGTDEPEDEAERLRWERGLAPLDRGDPDGDPR